jgi:hypothetical protein
MKIILTIVLGFFVGSSCVTSSSGGASNAKQPPAVTKDMSLEDALQAGIDFGGETARDVRKLISKRKQWSMAEKVLYQALQEGIIKYENTQLVNAVMLYISGPVTPQEALFQQMVSSGRPLARQLAWQMAAALPGKVMRGAIEREMNRAVFDDEEDELLIPVMASAVQANRMTSAYSLVRQGLFKTNDEEFAQAMAVLNPEQASSDFLNYLAICPPEELRQLTVSSINVFAANIALNHMMKYPPSISHPNIETLFYYSISRNTGLSEIATGLIDHLAQKNQSALTLALSRMPTWAQVAFIEGARRNLTAQKRVFLEELKKVASQAEIVDELGEINL